MRNPTFYNKYAIKIAVYSLLILSLISIFLFGEKINFYLPTSTKEFLVPRLKIIVKDTQEKPIKNARIVIEQTNGVFLTSNDGETEVIKIDNRSFVNILIFKEDYTDTVIYNVPLIDGKYKEVNCVLFEISPSSPEFFVFSETPTDAYTRDLIEKYKPLT